VSDLATPGASVSDAELAQAARHGDRDAFAAVFVRHRSVLSALCRRVLGGAGPVEDAVQEAALQAMLNLHSLRRPEQFGAWLCGIGLNVCRRLMRERARDAWSWDALLGGGRVREPIDPEPDPAERAVEADLARRVQRAVAGLPPGQRSAVLLVYFGGLTQAEASAALGTREGAVKSRLHKARAALKRTLLADWQEEPMTTEQAMTPIAMEIIDVRRKQAPSGEGRALYLAVLKERHGGRYLPIWIGPSEGTSLALLLQRTESVRPLTYTFAAAVLEAAGGRLSEVRIERLAEDTFYAVALIDSGGGVRTVDARPSDALCLALATGAPIRAQPAVLDLVGVPSDRWDAARPRTPEEASPRLAGEFADGAAEIAAEFRGN
jgi:RNA polymerase sigma factor (sigma-70 family)